MVSILHARNYDPTKNTFFLAENASTIGWSYACRQPETSRYEFRIAIYARLEDKSTPLLPIGRHDPRLITKLYRMSRDCVEITVLDVCLTVLEEEFGEQCENITNGIDF